MSRRSFGDQAEAFVAQQLQQDGFSICERNYQKRYGEIDIVAQKKDLIVFVEVKVRRSYIEHMPEIVTPSKQRKICMVAREYISRHSISNKICRFDVALVSVSGDGFELTYIPNAFQAT